MKIVRACILAAGTGRRLGDVADKPPKALLKFGGKTLLARHLENLAGIGVDSVAIGTGYRREDLESEARNSGFPGELIFAENPDFEDGSVITLAVLGEALVSVGGPVILMDADVLYDSRLMTRLANTSHENCLLVDRDFEDGDEPVKVCFDEAGQIVDFGKIVGTPFEWYGESVGFFRWSAQTGADLIARANTRIDNGDREAPYEEIIRDAILANPADFGHEDITGTPWLEIDFPQDVARAEAEILPLIETGIG